MSRFQRLVSVLLLLVAAAAAQETLRSLSLLHVGDLHAGLLPDIQGRGGFARLATAIRREQQGCTSCLLVNGGDLVQGTPVSTLFRGLPVYQIAGLFHFEVSTLGNHDFDYGWQMTRRFLKAGVSPIVSANVVDGGGHLITRHGYVIRNVNGMRVAVIGALMGNLGNYETPAKLGPWHSLPPIETVRKIAAETRRPRRCHRAAGPPGGRRAGRRAARGSRDCRHHWRSRSHGFERGPGIRAPAMGAGECCGRELGRLDLKVDVPAKKVASWNWKRIPIDATIPPASDMAARVAKWEKRVSKIVDVPIGESRREIEKLDLQRLVERAMAEETSADFGLVNLSGLRDKLPQGRLLARHVWNVMPFDNKVVIGKFKGSELPPVVAKAHPVDPNREYTLVTIDFLVETGALGTRGLTFPQTGPLLRDLLIDWIKKKQVIQ